MAELALEPTLELGDYLAVLRRRFGLIAVVSGIIFSIGLITAFILPPTYESRATILIEAQEVPQELIQSTVTSFAAQRIQVISQTVMTRTNLVEIMDRFDLYTEDRKRKTLEEILARMREDISVDMITADVVDPRTGRPASATIAFTIGFRDENPQKAQKVTNELTTLYLNENLKNRTEKAAETYDFLTAEADRLKEEIAEHETRLSEFKKKHLNVLPETRELNTQALNRAEREVENIDTQLQSLKEREIYLEGQLPLLDPHTSSTAMSPPERLEALNTEYIRLASKYSPDHPDVTAVKREIEALEIETGTTGKTDEIIESLENLRSELGIAEKNYTQEHPDIKSLKRRIAALEAELASQPADKPDAYENVSATNPAYVNLKTQLAAVKSEMGSLVTRRVQQLQKIDEYEQRLLQIPKIEQEYRAITRDLNHASLRYQDIRAKQMTAEVGQEMEKKRKGERFTLIDPPILPEEPVSPNRPAIIFLSLVLALGAGIGAAAAVESTDSAVRGVKGVMNAVQSAPLAVIPYLANTADIRRKTRRKRIIFFSLFAGLVIFIALVHFFYSPLDVLWFRGIRKVDNLVGG